jgi:peptide subunit release factor 1 (eRF1)
MDNKRSVPRHRKQSAKSADRQERAIERKQRQASKRAIKEAYEDR